MAEGSNFTFSQALNAYNTDQVMTQTMWYVEPCGTVPELDVVKYMQIYGQGFEVPERTNEFADVSYRGYNIPTPTVVKMGQDHNITINCDVHQILRRAFLAWQTRAIDPRINLQQTSFAADRRPTAGVGASGLRLYLLAPDMEKAEMQVRLYGVRVQSVGSLALSNMDGGIATFQVGFKSVYWQCDKADNTDTEGYNDMDAAKYPSAQYQPVGETANPQQGQAGGITI